MKDIPTKYEPQRIEEDIYKSWLADGPFHADEKGGGEPYSIVIPPPNITGILHMGHALNKVLKDIINKYKTLRGYKVHFVPG